MSLRLERYFARLALVAATVATTEGASAQTASATSDTALARFRAHPSALSTPAFAQRWQLSPERFRASWDSAFAGELRILDELTEGASPDVVARERMRLRFRYAWGRVTFPWFHWRETDAARVIPDPDGEQLVATLPLTDSVWWSMPEHSALVEALLHERARELLASRRSLRRGDVRWLRAEFAAAEMLFGGSPLVRDVMTRQILGHLDDSNSRGIDSVRGRWLALDPAPASVRTVDSLIAADLALREGHEIAVYKRVPGAELELHILRPTSGDTSGARPAMLWFHGGSGSTGSWSHTAGVARALRANGVTVIAVEFRTGNRFDPTPTQSAADAIDAYKWVERHARRLQIDPARIGVAGFSSGTGLALLLGTRGLGPIDRPPTKGERRYPAAVLVTGACPAPGGPREDGYWRKSISRVGKPEDYSPIDLIRQKQPPTLVIQGTDDEYCAYEDAKAFVERSRTAGNDAELSTVEGASHFFVFYHRPGQEQLRTATAAALIRWGWVRKSDVP